MDNEPKTIVKVAAAADDPGFRKEGDDVPADGNGVAAAADATTAAAVASSVAADEGGDGAGAQEAESQPSQRSSARTPFTDLSQVDADRALARALQEQERAYMMLRMNNDGSDYGSWEAGSYLNDDEEDFEDLNDDEDDDESDVEEGIGGTNDGTDIADEDAFDVHANEQVGGDNAAVEFDPDAFSSDEALARALQEAEEREMAAQMLALAGINDQEVEDSEDRHGNSQDNWEDVDTDEFSYEELLALSEVVGTESRGLSDDTIASLVSVSYKAGSSQHGTNDSCVICRLDYEDGETLTVLSCKHSYHHECINNWLQINKVCPVCSVEVSASLSS